MAIKGEEGSNVGLGTVGMKGMDETGIMVILASDRFQLHVVLLGFPPFPFP